MFLLSHIKFCASLFPLHWYINLIRIIEFNFVNDESSPNYSSNDFVLTLKNELVYTPSNDDKSLSQLLCYTLHSRWQAGYKLELIIEVIMISSESQPTGFQDANLGQ